MDDQSFWIQIVNGPRDLIKIASSKNVDAVRTLIPPLFGLSVLPALLFVKQGPEQEAQVLQPSIPIHLLSANPDRFKLAHDERDNIPILYVDVTQRREKPLYTVDQLLEELKTRPVFIELHQRADIVVHLVHDVEFLWHLEPSNKKPPQPPTLVFAGTPTLGDYAVKISDHETGKMNTILIPGFSPCELRATLRLLSGMEGTRIVDLWLLWSFLAGVPSFYAQLWKANKLQPLVKPFFSLDTQSLAELDDLFAIAATEYQYLRTQLPEETAQDALLRMCLHPSDETDEDLTILQKKRLLDEWTNLELKQRGQIPAWQQVVAPGIVRNVVVVNAGLSDKAALVKDLQARGLEQLVIELVRELCEYGVPPFPFPTTGRMGQVRVTFPQHEVGGVFASDSQLIIYDFKRSSSEFFAQEAPANNNNKNNNNKNKNKTNNNSSEESEKKQKKMDAVTMQKQQQQEEAEEETETGQEQWHFEAFLKNKVLPHVEALAECEFEFEHVHVIGLAGFMEHTEAEILQRMTQAAKFLKLGPDFSFHVDSLENFERRCCNNEAKVEFPVFARESSGWPLITRPVYSKVREAIRRSRLVACPLLLRGLRQCGKSCCLKFLKRELTDAKEVSWDCIS